MFWRGWLASLLSLVASNQRLMKQAKCDLGRLGSRKSRRKGAGKRSRRRGSGERGEGGGEGEEGGGGGDDRKKPLPQPHCCLCCCKYWLLRVNQGFPLRAKPSNAHQLLLFRPALPSFFFFIFCDNSRQARLWFEQIPFVHSWGITRWQTRCGGKMHIAQAVWESR